MNVLKVEGVRIAAVFSELPAESVEVAAELARLTGDAAKARAIVEATGIRTRRTAAAGTSAADLCGAAAARLLAAEDAWRGRIAAVVAVSFTEPRRMPAMSARIAAGLGLAHEVITLDLSLACSGYVHALYVAALLVRSTSGAVLLVDGDVQSPLLAEGDVSTRAVLADAGTATLLVPAADAPAMEFSFLTRGEEGDALAYVSGGHITMDGFRVYRFVAEEVKALVADFLAATALTAGDFAAFVPHQANVYMIRQLARSLGFADAALAVSADTLGNSASASVPVTLSRLDAARRGRLLLAGFGGGLSAAVAAVTLDSAVVLGG